MKKTLDIFAVRKIAFDLILEFGYTTTLDVKTALRNSNYSATQNQVSSIMDYLWEEGILDFDYNGKFRIYYIPDQVNYEMQLAYNELLLLLE